MVNSKTGRYETDITSLQHKISMSRDDLENLRQKNEDLVEKLKSFDNKTSLKADIESIKQDLLHKQPKSLIQLKQQLNEYFEQINQLSKELREERAKCDELKLEYQQKSSASGEKMQEQQVLIKRLTDALKSSRFITEVLVKKIKNLNSGRF